MAAYAAHLTRTLQGSPSIFQVAAQEALGTTVKPALGKLLAYLATQYPNKFGWCVKWYDELYLFFDCCLQYHYLKHYAASFSESFYGLLRVPTTASTEFNSGQRLSDFLEKASLILLVLLPYIKDKVERIVERWREDDEDGRLGKSKTDQARKAAIKVYAILHLSIELVKLTQLARYLAGRAVSHSPSLALLGLALRNAPAKSEEEHTWGDLFRAVLTGRLGNAVVTFPMLGGVLLRGVEYGAFVVQFVRWWDAAPHHHALALPTPAPPNPQLDEDSMRWKNRCPLCLRSWKTPTVLPVSGYIFCYVCISRHLRATNSCPVTKCPATEQSLVRLYVDD